jgi:hypothetical protein
MRSKRAAMELTMGTMVTIVLLVMVLILGGYFVNKIFFSARSSVDAIDEQVKSEINKLFAEDDTRKIVIFPSSRKISLEQGDQGSGFAFSIRNVGTEPATFSYEIKATEVSCPNQMSLAQAESLIALRRTGKDIQISAGLIMADATHVTFSIPETTPPCLIGYTLTMQREGELYGSSLGIDVKIEPA